MSGGSYDYVYGRIHNAAEAVRASVEHVVEPVELHVRRNSVGITYEGPDAARLRASIAEHRRWLADVMDVVALAMHDVEWVDSCDTSEGSDVPAIAAIAAVLARRPAVPPELSAAGPGAQILAEAVRHLSGVTP